MAVNCCGPGEDIEDEDYGGNYTAYMNANDKNKYVDGWVNAQQTGTRHVEGGDDR